MKNDSVILSGTTGVVTSVDATVGLASPGVIMTIQDDKNLEVNADIKEKDIFSIKEGMNVEFSNSTLTNVTGKGSIVKINNFATSEAASTSAMTAAAAGQAAAPENTFKVKLKIAESTDIMIGMKLKARIATGEELKTNAVPYTAIMGDAEGDYVYVAEAMSGEMYQVVRKSVEKGMSGDYYTEIKGGDLVEGDKVISYPSTVQEGSIIKINEEQ